MFASLLLAAATAEVRAGLMRARLRSSLVLTCAVAGAIPASTQDEAPKRLGLEERVQRRLAQLDVSLTGPAEALPNLAAKDFSLTVRGKSVPIVAIDSFCGRPSSDERPVEKGRAGEVASKARPTSSYLFYFDHQNTSFVGRANSLDQARRLIPKLIHDGNRGAIVVSGTRTVTYAVTTDRAEDLLASLTRLEADVGLWDNYPQLERSRQDEMARILATRSRRPEDLCGLARTYQRDELARAEHAMEILSRTLGRFADVDGPKVALYFADTLRDEPGRHYLSIAGPDCTARASESFLSFRKVHQNAAAFGVRVYSVQAEGLVPPPVSGARAARELALRDGHDGLKTMALETGGDAFLNGAAPDYMAARIESDQACVYTLSFDPARFPEDTPLLVSVSVNVPKVRPRSRTQIVIQSEAARRMSTLLAAFAAPDTVRDPVPIRGAIVPLDLQGEQLKVLLQASLPETRLPSGEQWDVGISVVTEGVVDHQASGRVIAGKPGVRIVFETEAPLFPGPYDIALVATEGPTGQIAIGRLSGEWTGDFANGVAFTSILQPMEGAFVRDGKVRENGSLAVVGNEPVRADRPAAIVTLICKTSKRQASVRVQRALIGPSGTAFPPLDMPFGGAACTQVRDVIPAGSLGPGTYTYEIGVEGKNEKVSRGFAVH